MLIYPIHKPILICYNYSIKIKQKSGEKRNDNKKKKSQDRKNTLS